VQFVKFVFKFSNKISFSIGYLMNYSELPVIDNNFLNDKRQVEKFEIIEFNGKKYQLVSYYEDKAGVFTRLIQEKKLPAMAVLKNIRLMEQSGVDIKLIRDAIKNLRVDRILPFRFITAARYNPDYEDVLEESMLKCLEGMEKLSGKTLLLIDVSGSMNSSVSKKSELSRLDAANGIAILGRELCEEASIYTFSDKCVKVAPRRGFALRDAIVKSQPHGCTYLAKAIKEIKEDYDRIVVFTDEQSHDGAINPKSKGYCVNVASYQNGVCGAGSNWVSITGFSESALRYICEYEKFENSLYQ
jgi:hypothetical protein